MDYSNQRASYALSAQSSALTMPGTNPYAVSPGVVPNASTRTVSNIPSTAPGTTVNFLTAFQQPSTQEVGALGYTSGRATSRQLPPQPKREPEFDFKAPQTQEEPDFENSDCCNFIIGFLFALLLSPGVFLFLCCAPTLGIRGRKVKSFLWGAGLGNLLTIIASVTVCVLVLRNSFHWGFPYL